MDLDPFGTLHWLDEHKICNVCLQTVQKIKVETKHSQHNKHYILSGWFKGTED